MEKSWIGKVDENGVIEPSFEIDDVVTSGKLKYFQNIKGKYVRVTVEVLVSEIWGRNRGPSILDIWEESAQAKIKKDGEL